MQMIYVSTETKWSSGLGHGFYYNLNLSLIARTRQTDRGGSGTNIYILGVRIHIQESFFFSEILKELSKKIRQRKRISPFLFHLHFGKDLGLLRYLRNLSFSKSQLQCELAVSKLVEYTVCVCAAQIASTWGIPTTHFPIVTPLYLQTPSVFWTSFIFFLFWIWTKHLVSFLEWTLLWKGQNDQRVIDTTWYAQNVSAFCSTWQSVGKGCLSKAAQVTSATCTQCTCVHMCTYVHPVHIIFQLLLDAASSLARWKICPLLDPALFPQP